MEKGPQVFKWENKGKHTFNVRKAKTYCTKTKDFKWNIFNTMFKTFTSYTQCKNSVWGGKRVGRQRTQYDYLCPDGPSTRDTPNKDENIKELGITAPGSVQSIRPLGTCYLTKWLLLLKRRRKIFKAFIFLD